MANLPNYDFCYLGDNARSPYGNRSFETVTRYTQQCVETLFSKGCNLVVLACNTASAKALRTIQQGYLIQRASEKRVLGVIRPTSEVVGTYSKTGSIGILGTSGTVNSDSYPSEIRKFFPNLKVYQQACPMWVSLVENNEYDGDGADFFIKKYLDELFNQSSQIDTIVLGCTHYPLLLEKIKHHLPPNIRLIAQGEIVAMSLLDYLNRHPEIDSACLKNSHTTFYTSDNAIAFDTKATYFFGEPVKSSHIDIGH